MKFIKGIATSFTAMLIVLMISQSTYAFSGEIVLKSGMHGSNISNFQQNLLKLGYFTSSPTGYFGSKTKKSVIEFQKNNGLNPDGMAGKATLGKITSMLNTSMDLTTEVISRDGSSLNAKASNVVQLLPWFGEVENIYAKGDVATVVDVETGLKMQIKRTYGTNHADVETLTAEDTATLKEIAGGSWNWTRRPVIVEIDGYRIAGSLTAKPHAGRDDMPANVIVSNRSGNYGRGQNLDAVKGNNMDGQFDIHFSGSKTHRSNKIDRAHQQAIKQAYDSNM
jgi:peptidoglycan hydrolase-like protein with peptidoglycan-binding domain